VQPYVTDPVTIVGVNKKHRTLQHWNIRRSYGDGESIRRAVVTEYESLRKTAPKQPFFYLMCLHKDKGRQEEAANVVSVYFSPNTDQIGSEHSQMTNQQRRRSDVQIQQNHSCAQKGRCSDLATPQLCAEDPGVLPIFQQQCRSWRA
jgi:hypothetical protein